MSGLCHACSNELTGECITCQGFCDATFHANCCGSRPDFVADVIRSSQSFWLCPSCSKLMKDIKFRKSVRSAHDAGQAGAFGVIEQLKAEILSELKNEIRSNFTAIVNSSALTPRSSRQSPLAAAAHGRKLLLEPIPSQRPQPALMEGTSKSVSPSLGVTTVPLPKGKCWIYLSRISRDVSADQIVALANNRLGTSNAEAIRLVAKGRDISTLSFISFKVSVDADLKDKALSPSTWPSGILYREFNDDRGNFWRPGPTQATPPKVPERDPLSCPLSPEKQMLTE